MLETIETPFLGEDIMKQTKKSKENKGVQKLSKLFPKKAKLTAWELLKWFTVLIVMVITTGLVYLLIEWRTTGNMELAIQTGLKEALAVMLYTIIFGILIWLLFKERLISMVEKATRVRIRRGIEGLKKSEWYYKGWRVITSSIIYVILFWFLVMKMSTGIMEWVMTVITGIISMIFGNISARMITKSEFKENKDFQLFVRTAMILLLYSTFTWVLYHFRAFERLSFWLLWLFFILGKAFIFLIADFFADRMSFGG